MPPTLTQANRPLQTVVTPLGPDDLIPISFEGEEAVSKAYNFSVDFVSTDAAIAASAVLGKPMCIRVAMEGGTERYFHGVVSRFSSRGRRGDFAVYRAELVPSFWLLSLATDCRSFEELSALDIVEKVLREKNVVPELELKVTAPPKKLPFVVQYRESNLAFVSRLLEDAGLYFFFRHEKEKHTMVISDAHAGSIPAPAVAEVKVSNALTADAVEVDAVAELSREYAVHSAGVSLRDHDLLRADSVGTANSNKPGANGELFDFLGDLGPNDSTDEAKRLIEGAEAEHDQLEGTGTCAAFEAGRRVKVTGGPLGASGSELLILRVRHSAEAGDMIASSGLESSYRNGFVCIPAAARYRPPRQTAWPSVQGTQIAKVVGSGGAAEIDVDANGCVLLQFPWDRGAGKDGRSKHRVHVASVWGGAGWGFVQLPRIGQEVLVEFLEGDPDRPIITGRVFNSAHKPPYALPGDKTQSGWKSRTVGGGDGNFNELRFEDKKGEEHVYLQAEKDLKALVKNDETRNVGHDRTTTIKNNETRTVEEGDDLHWIKKGHHTTTVEKGDHSVVVSEGNHIVQVYSNQQVDVEAGDRTVTIEKGNDELTVTQGNLVIKVDQGNVTIKAAAGKIMFEAAQGIELKCGGSSIKMTPSAITTKSVMIKTTADAMAKLKATVIKVEGTAMCQIKAPMVKVEGQAMTTVKGAITQVTGDGMLKAGGGITMLG